MGTKAPQHFYLLFLILPAVGLFSVCQSLSIVKRDATADRVYFTELPTGIKSILDGIVDQVTSSNEKDKIKVLTNVLEDERILGELENPSLTYSQIYYIFNLILENIPVEQRNESFAMTIPSNLVISHPFSFILDHKAYKENGDLSFFMQSLVDRFEKLTPAQRLATFVSLIQEKKPEGSSLNLRKIPDVFQSMVKSETSVPKLFQYIGVDSFRDYFDDFKISLLQVQDNTEFKQEVTSKIAVPMLPSLLKVWLKKNGFKSSVRLISPAVLSANCEDIKDLGLGDLYKTLEAYNILRMQFPFTPFPVDLKFCFRDRIIEHLKKRQRTQGDSPLNELRFPELQKIGASVLSSFSVEDFKKVKGKHAIDLFHLIGTLPMRDIITGMSFNKARELANLAVSNFFFPDEVSFEDLNMLGTFIPFTDADVLGKTTDINHLTDFFSHFLNLDPFKMVCFDKKGRQRFRDALIKVYGPTSRWTLYNLTDTGKMLPVLENSDLSELSTYVKFYYWPIFQRDTDYHENYLHRPMYSNDTKILHVCADWLGGEEGEGLVESFNQFIKHFLETSKLRGHKEKEMSGPTVSVSLKRKRRQTQTAPSPLEQVVIKVKELISKQKLPPNVPYLIHSTSSYVTNQAFIEIASKLGEPNVFTFDGNFTALLATLPLEDQEIIKPIREKFNEKLILEIVRLTGITHVDMNWDESLFCRLFLKICERVDYPYRVYVSTSGRKDYPDITPTEISEAEKIVPSKFTCDGLKDLKDSAHVLHPIVLLDTWDKEEFEKCLDVLGNIEWDLERKRDLWRMMTEKKVHVTQMKKIPHHFMIAMNNLLEAVALTEAEALDLDVSMVLEPISQLGEFQFSLDQLKMLTQHIKNNSKLYFENGFGKPGFAPYDLVIFGSLKHLVCGFPSEDIQSLLKQESLAEILLPILGQMKSCPNKDVLRLLADKAIDIFGEPKNWDSSVILSLGVIISGLEPEKFAQLRECCLGSISRETFSHLEFSQLKELNVQQMSALPLDALANIDVSKLHNDKAVLVDDLIRALNETVLDFEDHSFVSNQMRDFGSEVKLLNFTQVSSESTSKESASSIGCKSSLLNIILCAFIVAIFSFQSC